MIPVRQRRNEDAFEVRKDFVERLADIRRRCGQRLADVPGRHLRQHRVDVILMLEVFSDPVDERVAVTPELVAVHQMNRGWRIVSREDDRQARRAILPPYAERAGE